MHLWGGRVDDQRVDGQDRVERQWDKLKKKTLGILFLLEFVLFFLKNLLLANTFLIFLPNPGESMSSADVMLADPFRQVVRATSLT